MKYGFLIRGKAIIIEMPRTIAPEGNRLAVGFSDESSRVWRAFLTLSEVKCGQTNGWHIL